jgi:phospholipid/cholesterol/gamma-HCH transport system substrate-binding protein
MSERTQRFRLGLFVLVSLLLLGALVVMFGGAPGWFTRTNSYTILFSDAPGVASGTPVRKSGVKVGEVSTVELDNETGQVRVTVRLDPKFTPRNTDEPTVTRGLIVNDTAIDFIPRADAKERGEPIPPGAVIAGVSAFNARALIDQTVPEAQRSLEQVRKAAESIDRLTPQMQATMRQVGDLAQAGKEFLPDLRRTNDALRDVFVGSGDLAPTLRGLVGDLRKTNDEARYFLKTSSFWVEEAGVMLARNEPRFAKAIDSFAVATDRLGELLNPENQKAFSETLKNIRDASVRFPSMTAQAEDLLKDGKVTMRQLNSTLAQADQAVAEIRQVTKPFAERGARIAQNLETATDQFSRTMIDVRKLVDAVGRSEGAFQRFIADPSLYNNINEAAASINRLMPRLDRILKDVEVFADKIARHPEALGIGGAVRPSAGLKEAPTAPGPSFKPWVP